MDSFIFNDYTKRLLNGEVNSSQVWNFLPVNRKFVETLENCSSMNYKQFRNTSDIGCYSADGLTEHRKTFLYNSINDTYSVSPFYDVVSSMGGLVEATYSKITYTKASDTFNKPLYIDSTVSDDDLERTYGIILNDEHKKYKDNGFYYVIKASELNWLADRCEKNNTFNICLGDNIFEENLIKPIGSYEHPYQGTFDGCGYVFSSCNISVDKELNGVIGVLGNLGEVKNVRIADMSFSGNNVLNLTYSRKYNNDINVGFVAKNYGNVHDVSSIGDNYLYGLSPAIYSTNNKTDDKGGEYSRVFKVGYLIDQDFSNAKFYNKDCEWKYYDKVAKTESSLKKIIISSDDGDIIVEDRDFISFYYTDTGSDDGSWPVLVDFLGNELESYGEYKQFFKKVNSFNSLISHTNNEYKIKTLNGETEIEYDDLVDSFNNNKYYYECDGILMDLIYIEIGITEFNDGVLKANIKNSSNYIEVTPDNFKNNILNIVNNSENIYHNTNTYNKCFVYYDGDNNIHPYYGYFGCNILTQEYCKGFENTLKHTYIVSPIIGSNYNIVSGCLNNSNIYFGINSDSSYNPFAGEYGGIAGYNEGNVINNTSNCVIKDYKNDISKYSHRFYKIFDEGIELMENSLVKLIYEKNVTLKNYLIFGNLVGRDNLYSNSSLIENNLSNLIIEKTDNFNVDYFRPSMIMGSTYASTVNSSVSSYKSNISGNSGYIDNKDECTTTLFSNELFLDLNEYPNIYHYSNKGYDSNGSMYYYETDTNYINAQKRELNEIVKKYNSDNTCFGVYKKCINVNIPNTSFIAQNYTYISNASNHLKNCTYTNGSTTTTSLSIDDIDYDLNEGNNIDNGFDIGRYMVNMDYKKEILKPLSAKVEFNYDNISFNLIDKENNLYWGTSANPNDELKCKTSLNGEVINSKDFAGVIVYDNDGNLVGYHNNYKTNVIYNTYSLVYENDVIMEIGNDI